MTLDHGTLSGIRRRSTPRQRRREDAALDRTIDQAVAEVKAAKEAERQAAQAAYEAKNRPVLYTPEQLATARIVRTKNGWHPVISVNTKTVTVKWWGDETRFPLTQILEVKQ